MGTRTLTEDFRRMGLTDNEVSASLRALLGEAAEADEADIDADDVDGEDVLDIVEAYKRRKKLRGKKKMAAKRYRKSAAGKKSARRQAKKRKSASYKRRASKRRAKLSKMGTSKKGYVRVLPSSREYEDDGESLRESLMSNLQVLAEATDHDPESRFDEYVEAFNNIADLGELLTIHYHEMGLEEMAEESILVAMLAESILDDMEDFGNVVNLEQDAMLEDVLAEAMSVVEEELEDFGEIVEDFEDEDEDELEEDEDFEDEDFEDEDEDELEEAKRKKKKKKTFTYKGKKVGQNAKAMLSYIKGGKVKMRKDIRNPDALAGYLARNGPFEK